MHAGGEPIRLQVLGGHAGHPATREAVAATMADCPALDAVLFADVPTELVAFVGNLKLPPRYALDLHGVLYAPSVRGRAAAGRARVKASGEVGLGPSEA